MKEIDLNVEGMMCAHCEHAVETAVAKIGGVKKVKASAGKKSVKIKYDGELKKDEVLKAISDEGYTVKE